MPLTRLLHAYRSATRQTIHFLHIGKNAGTQITYLAEQINRAGPVHIVIHGHTKKLLHLSAGARYFFPIRRPETRFVSGFYSRKRKGQPRMYRPWTKDEAIAFRRFEHANDLAEALFAPGAAGDAALAAMKSINHVSFDQIDWFDRRGNFLETHPPVDIIRQEHFDTDIARFLRRIGHDGPAAPTEDPVKAHRNDYDAIPPLSDKARENLFHWYRQDHAFYAMCERWIASRD